MPLITPPFVLEASAHTSANFRQMLHAAMGRPFGAFTGGVGSTAAQGAHGVVSATDMAVTQNGTPNMSVNVAGGAAFITGTESNHQGTYGCYNDAVVNLVVSAADPTNGRRDLVCVRVRDTFYSGASNDVQFFMVNGTAAAAPVDPTPPANALVLARLTVGAAVTSVVTGNIADLRTRAYALGAIGVGTTAQRPTAPFDGQVFQDSTLASHIARIGGGWEQLAGPLNAWTSYTPALTASVTNPTLGTAGVTVGAFMRIGRLIIGRWSVAFGTAGMAAGSGNYRVSLPVTPVTTGGSPRICGVGYIQDVSLPNITTTTAIIAAGEAFQTLAFSNPGALVTHATYAWAINDQLNGLFAYEAAAGV